MTEQQYFEKSRTAKNKQAEANQPTSTTPDNVQRALDLQRLVGNQQAQRLLRQTDGSAKPSTFIQTKMTVGAADDPYEREADQMADHVVNRITSGGESAGSDVQRAGEEEEMIQGKRIQREGEEDEMQLSRIQREGEEEEMQLSRIQREGEEDEMIQGKRIQREGEEEEMQLSRIQREDVDMMGSFDVGGAVEDGINSARGGGQALPDETRGQMEGAMGYDLSGVRVHTDSNAESLNRSVSAKAFTTGSDIFFSGGSYDPGSQDGQKLLAHELTHVVQQGHAAPKVQTERDDK